MRLAAKLASPLTASLTHLAAARHSARLSPRATHILRCAFSSSPTAQLAQLNASNIEKKLTDSPKPLLPNKDLIFGHNFTDHMLTVTWSKGSGWANPQIVPYGPLSLDPSCSVFHYAFECFEGLKAYKDKEGNIRLFRPDMNMARMNSSTHSLNLPQFDGEEMIKCIKELVKTDSRWIPEGNGYSLYIRPTMIATEPTLGVHESRSALFFCICSPCGPYFPTGFKAIRLFTNTEKVRAWKGGMGNRKVGGNYAPSVLPQVEAAKLGYQQVLWTIGEDHELMEVGTMNLFVFWKNEQGEMELITPELDGTILPGVTRDSILSLARSWGEFKITEGKINMKQLTRASNEGRLYEVFGAGTACVVTPVRCIHYQGKDYDIPLDPNDPQSEAGPITRRLHDTLTKIQYGEIPSEWSVVIN